MQQVIKGHRTLLQLPLLLKQNGRKKVLFVTGHHVRKDDTFISLLSVLNIPYQIIHPPEGVLQQDAIPTFTSLDAVVAIGGGKTIDYAKGILYKFSQPVFFVAAPTTAGSGSEATPIAVFYKETEKVSLDAPHLLPGTAILDTSLLANLPTYQRAVSGADALAQSIESVWNINSTEISENYALQGLTLAWRYLPIFVQEPQERIASEILWAAHLAGRAITLTRTTGPHALSYYLTANHGVPHGQAVALTLPIFFLYNHTEETRQPLKKIFTIMDVSSEMEAFTVCRQLFHTLGLATTLTELQLQQIDLDEWLASVNRQRFGNNPVTFDAPVLKELLQRYLY